MRTPQAVQLFAVAVVCASLAMAVSAGEAGPFLYTDSGGSTHMVQTFEEIPGKYRKNVRSLGTKPGSRVEYQARTTTMTPKRAERTRVLTEQMAKVPERQREEVIFYTASWCGFCKQVEKHLRRRGIPYDERSIDEPAIKRELVGKIGNAFVPVVEYEDERIIGYNPKALDALGL